MPGETLKRREEIEGVQREAVKPPVDLSQIRPVVREQVSKEAIIATDAIYRVHDIFTKGTEKDAGMRETWRNFELTRFRKNRDAFRNCQVQYAYNQRQEIYSIKTTLDNRPRIITLRVGDNFTELSLANKEGRILELARQEDGKGITLTQA